MQQMTTQMQFMQEQMRVGQLKVQELQATVQHQAAVISSLQSSAPASTSSDTSALAQVLPHFTEAVASMKEVINKMEDRGGTVDMKNVGKPFTFKGDEAQFLTWVKKLKNYIGAGFGRDARLMMDWAEDQASTPITESSLQERFGAQAGFLSRVE